MDNEETGLACTFATDSDFGREDAVAVIADKLRRKELVHFPIGEHWTAVLRPTVPEIPATGDMAPVTHVSVLLHIFVSTFINKMGNPERVPGSKLPGVIVLRRDLGKDDWGYVHQGFEGVCGKAYCEHVFVRGETLSHAVRETLAKCCSIFSKIQQHYEDLRRAKESREESIKRGLAEHARRMSL